MIRGYLNIEIVLVQEGIGHLFLDWGYGGPFLTTSGFWAWSPYLLVLWVRLIPQWEIQQMTLKATTGAQLLFPTLKFFDPCPA